MNYIYPLLILLCLTIIFHVFLVYLYPQSKKFWKGVDYFWISLGFMGIIGAMTSLKREFSLARINYFEQPLTINYNGLTESTESKINYFLDTINGFNYSEFPDRKQSEDFKKAGVFFTLFSNETVKYRDTILIYKNLNYIDTLKNSYNEFKNNTTDQHVKHAGKLTEFYLMELEHSKSEFEDNEILRNKNSLDWILLFISPYLLAVAIAIRLTKVTAEIKDLK